MKTIIYCRKSTESEERQVQSLEAQLDWCREYCQSRGFEVVEEIIESKSAKNPGREGFNDMMKKLSNRKAEVIVTWQLNRLSRNPIDEGSIKWLTQQGIIKEIHSTDGISNGQNILLMSVHFGMATQYVIDLKKNVERGMNQKFEKGGALGKAPAGYWNNKNTGEYEIQKEEAKFIKEAFKLKSKGYSYKEISEILFKKGFKTRSGKPKTPGNIQHIIRNEFYIGLIKFKGNTALGKHKAIVSKKLFDEANGLIKPQTIRKDPPSEDFIFRGLLKYKGRAMAAYKTKGNVYYRSGNGITPSFNISQNLLIEKIEDELKNYVLPECLVEDFNSGLLKYFDEMNKGNKNNIIQARKNIDEIKEENKALVRKNIIGKIDDDLFMEMQKENLLKIKDLENELSDYSKADELIEEEVFELSKMFTHSQKIFKEANLYHKAQFLKIFMFELDFEDKKRLSIQNTKLFSLIREINFTIWWS